MTLAELLENLDGFDDNLTIYAEKNPFFSPESRAITCPEEEVQNIYDKKQGLSYLLEVFIAKEVVQAWIEVHGDNKPSIEDICEAVIYYAENDAYPPI